MSKYIVYDIFYVFRECKEYAKTARRVNDVYGTNFNGDQIKRILKNPLYRGHPRYSEKHSDIVVPDESLRVVEDELFFEVQEIIKEKDNERPIKKESVTFDLMEEHGDSILEPHELGLMCITCKVMLSLNGTRPTKYFIQQGYKCPKCGKALWLPTVAKYKEQQKKAKEEMKERNPLISITLDTQVIEKPKHRKRKKSSSVTKSNQKTLDAIFRKDQTKEGFLE